MNITIVFHLAGHVFRVLDSRSISHVEILEAFKKGCTAAVQVNQVDLPGMATNVNELYKLLGEASISRGFQCASCGA